MECWNCTLEGLVVNKKFWIGKKVLITGHTGFKGSWLSLWLQHLGAEIIGLSLDPPTKPSLYEQANIADGILSLREDIRNGEKIKNIFNEHKPEIIFHLAAQPLVRYSYREPVETYETNVMGTLHVLEAIRSIDSVRAAIMVTTDKCYDNKEWEWGYREIEAMGGKDPYSSSKGAAELLIASYRDSYFPNNKYFQHKTAIGSVRAGNVIGGGDWAEDRLIPDMIRAFTSNENLHIRNPNSIRPWQHILDLLYGYMLLAENLTVKGSVFAEAWNFGPLEGGDKTVKWIVENVNKSWGGGLSWSIDKSEQPHEATLLKLDCAKAHKHLGWYPCWDLKKSLDMIVQWHKKCDSSINMKKICIEQISSYMMDQKNDRI